MHWACESSGRTPLDHIVFGEFCILVTELQEHYRKRYEKYHEGKYHDGKYQVGNIVEGNIMKGNIREGNIKGEIP